MTNQQQQAFAAMREALNMLNEMHERMGFELVYKLKMERLAVDKIAAKHIQAAYERGLTAAKEVTAPKGSEE